MRKSKKKREIRERFFKYDETGAIVPAF